MCIHIFRIRLLENKIELLSQLAGHYCNGRRESLAVKNFLDGNSAELLEAAEKSGGKVDVDTVWAV